MDWLIAAVTEHAQYAHWVIFGALLLAGINLPVSEDLMLILAGVAASTIVPEHTIVLFVFVFLGAYLSDWIAYWIGRKLGPALWRFRPLARVMRPVMNPSRFEKVRSYYMRYGIITLVVGRFIPFGIRNCLFMTAGLVKMPFTKFILFDGLACLASNSLIFWLAFAFGRNYSRLRGYLEVIDIVIFLVFLLAVIAFIWYKKSRKATT